MKTSEVINSKTVIEKLIGQDLPVLVSFKIKKVIKEVETILEIFEEKRKKLFEEYGEEIEVSDDNPQGGMQVSPEYIDVFNDKMQEILDSDIEIDFKKIKVNELAGAKMSTADLLMLDWLIVE